MNKEKNFYTFLSEIFEENINENRELKSLKKWDSINILRYMLYFKKEFGKEINVKDFLTAHDIQDLYKLVYKEEEDKK